MFGSSSVLRLSVGGPSGPLPGSRLVSLLRNQLLRDKSDYLLFRVLRVDTVCEWESRCFSFSELVLKKTDLSNVTLK